MTIEDLLSQASEAIAKAEETLNTANESANKHCRETADHMAAAQEQMRGRVQTTEIAPRARDLLVKTLGMLGSNQDGECLSAARKAEAQRKKLGLMWGDLIVPAQVAQKTAA